MYLFNTTRKYFIYLTLNICQIDKVNRMKYVILCMHVFLCFFGQICTKFCANLIKIKKIMLAAPSGGAIWDKLSE